MSGIEQSLPPVFRAKATGRRYLTARAAANAEACALLIRKYPTEAAEYENGMCYFPGYHWSGDERLVRVHARLRRLILKSFRAKEHA